jgi:hypothetical protein
MCKGGGGTNTVTNNSQPPPQVLAAYTDAYNRAVNAVSSVPNPVAPLNDYQLNAIWNSNTLASDAQPYTDRAYNLLNQSTLPLSGQIPQYLSPYIQNVVDATQAQFNNQNAIQQQGVIGNAIARGAWGGDRSAVAQGIVAGQQQLAQAPIIAGLYNQGYNTATQTAEAQAALQQQAAGQTAQLGLNDYNINLGTLNAELAAGQIYQNNQQQVMSLPYTQANYIANIAEGLGAGMGGTSSTTTPGPSLGSQILGTGLGAAGLLGATGAFGSAGWLGPALAALKVGGRIPHHAAGGVVSGDDDPLTSADVSVIPPVRFIHAAGLGPPKPPPGPQQDQSLTPQGVLGSLKSSGALGENGWLKSLIPSSSSPGTGGLYRRGGIVPEPDGDLHAQFGAMMDPFSAKDAVFVARRPEGTLFTTHIGKAHHFARGGVDDASMAGILGYPETKAQAMASGAPRVVQGISPLGHVVVEMAASPEGEWSARDVAARHVPSGIVRTVSVPAALARRGAFARGGDVADLLPHAMAPDWFDVSDTPGSQAQHPIIDDNPAAEVAAAVAADPTGTGASPAAVALPAIDVVAAPKGAANWETRHNNFAGMRIPGVYAGPNSGGFQEFDTPEAGIAAIGHQLDRYVSGATTGRPVNTLRGIVNTWAPPSENDTPLLLRQAVQWTGIDPDQPVDLADPTTRGKVITAMIRNEQGGALPIDPAVIAKVAADPSAYSYAPASRNTGIAGPAEHQVADAAPTFVSDAVPDTASGIVPRASTISSSAADAVKKGDINPWLALAAAGFGVAAGRSPYALQNLGAGALEGLKFYQGLRTVEPEMRLKNAQAELAETDVARLKAARAYYAGQSSNPQPVVDMLNGRIDTAKKNVADGGMTQAVQTPQGAVAPINPGGAVPVNPAGNAVATAPATQIGAPPLPVTLTPEQQRVENQVRANIAEIDDAIRQQRAFGRDPADPAVTNLIIRRSDMVKELPSYQAATAAAKVAAENPGLIERAGGIAAAELPYKPWDARAGSIHGVGNTPLFAVPTPRTITDPKTGEKREEYFTPPLPGQTGQAGSPQGGPVGQSWVTGVSEPTKAQIKTEQEGFEEAKKEFGAAQSVQQRLGMMDHAIDQLNQSGWSSTGSGANMRLGAARDINSFFGIFGAKPLFDPSKVASWEDLNKETTRAGFELARTLGSREAAMIVQAATAAVPNAENSAMGAKLVSSSLNQAAQRQIDYYQFLNDWGNAHGGRLNGADIAFNQQHPTQDYVNRAIVAAIPPQAVALLKSNPALAIQFDQKYGSGISNSVLGR